MELEDELEARLIPKGVQSQLFTRPQGQAVFYRSGPRRRLIDQFTQAMAQKPPLVLLVGEAQTGKSTLLQMALADQPTGQLLLFDEANLSLNGVMQTVAHALHPKGELPRYQSVEQFQQHLRQYQQRGRHLLLAFEQGDRLDVALLRALLQSSASENGKQALFTTVLMGPPVFPGALQGLIGPFQPRMLLMEAFHAADVSTLVQLEIHATGYPENDFVTPQAIQYLAEHSRGLPGVVSDVATLAATLRDRNRCVTVAVMKQAFQQWENQPRPRESSRTIPPPGLPLGGTDLDATAALSELAASLETTLNEYVAPVPSPPKRRSHRALIGGGLIALLSLVAGGWWTWQTMTPVPPPLDIPIAPLALPPPPRESLPAVALPEPLPTVPPPAVALPEPLPTVPPPPVSQPAVDEPLVAAPLLAPLPLDNPAAVNPPSVVPPQLLMPSDPSTNPPSTLPFAVEHRLQKSSSEGVFVEEHNAPDR